MIFEFPACKYYESLDINYIVLKKFLEMPELFYDFKITLSKTIISIFFS